jgi:hypothetical protein
MDENAQEGATQDNQPLLVEQLEVEELLPSSIEKKGVGARSEARRCWTILFMLLPTCASRLALGV